MDTTAELAGNRAYPVVGDCVCTVNVDQIAIIWHAEAENRFACTTKGVENARSVDQAERNDLLAFMALQTMDGCVKSAGRKVYRAGKASVPMANPAETVEPVALAFVSTSAEKIAALSVILQAIRNSKQESKQIAPKQ